MRNLERGPEMGDLPEHLRIYFKRNINGPLHHHEEIIYEDLWQRIRMDEIVNEGERGIAAELFRRWLSLKVLFIPLTAWIIHRREHSADSKSGK